MQTKFRKCKQNLEISDDKFKMWAMCFRIGTVANTNDFNNKKKKQEGNAKMRHQG